MSNDRRHMTRAQIAERWEPLQRIADFDHPFQVTQDGKVQDAHGFHAPEVFHVEGQRTPNDIEIGSDEWEALTGYTGQYSYNGAVMHASEFYGGGLADDILAHPGTYVAVVVEVLDDHEHPAGWVTLRKKVTWVADGPPQSGGTVGGDGAGESMSIRYTSPEVPGALITSHWYTVDLRERNQADDDDSHPWDVEHQVEYMRCTDVTDPGSTEVECDYEYEQPLSVSFMTEAMAASARDASLARESAEYYGWNGASRS